MIGERALTDNSDNERDLQICRDIVIGLHEAGCPVTSLTAVRLPFEFFAGDMYCKPFVMACKKLTDVSLDIDIVGLGTGDKIFSRYVEVIKSGSLRHFLSSLKHLRSLDLSFGDETEQAIEDALPLIYLELVLPLKPHFSNLQRISLGLVGVRKASLVRFLHSNAATLRHFELRNVCLGYQFLVHMVLALSRIYMRAPKQF